MKIYTKTGDKGTTGLFAGPRVSKDHPRIQAYGAVDELNALLGVANTKLPAGPTEGPSVVDALRSVQSDLFSIGAQLATPNPIEHGMCLLTAERVTVLEAWIDRFDGELPSLNSFILPGGSEGAAVLHLARTVCRRAERDIVSLTHYETVENPDLLIVYLNRLSDLLFVLARWVNHAAGIRDLAWHRPEPEA